jgi:hypothetical protein
MTLATNGANGTYHEEQAAGLELMARLTSSPLKVKTFINSWILLTFDLPTTEAGNTARREFLGKVRRMGAVMQTESVYYMPWTPETSLTALDLAKAGEVYLWYSKVPDDQHSIDLTRDYDAKLLPEINKLAERATRIMGHLSEGHDKMAQSMLGNTWDTANGLAKAVAARGSEDLAQRLDGVLQVLKLAQKLADRDPATLRVFGAP